MRNFSINSSSNQCVIEQYTDFLSREVYRNMQPYDVKDPLFLQQLGILQAEGIKRAINDNSVVAFGGFQELNATVENSANFIGKKIGSIANMLTSSLDKSFTELNNSLLNIDIGIETTNVHLSNINSRITAVNTNLSEINNGIQSANNNLIVLGKLVGQGFSILHNQLSQSNKQLGQILQELKIPETQRERRYRIEEGSKYLTLALQNGDTLYFDDAFDEFNTALSFEKKDWFSWFNIGLIHIRSKEHINPQKAIDAFKKTVHYGRVEVAYAKNMNLENKIDESHLYMAESYYLLQDYNSAIFETEQCLYAKDKADFMKVKYLSATNEHKNKKVATDILSKLINDNPFMTLQILEDDDILRNEDVLKFLENIRVEKNNKAKQLLKESKIIRNKRIEKLISTGKFLDAHEAIFLLNTISETKKVLKEFEKKSLSYYQYYQELKQKNITSVLKEQFLKLLFLFAMDFGEENSKNVIQLAKQIIENLDYYFYRECYKDFQYAKVLTKEYERQEKLILETKWNRILEPDTPSWILDIAAIENIVKEESEVVPVLDWHTTDNGDCYPYYAGPDEVKIYKIQLNDYIKKHKNSTQRTLDIIAGCHKF